MSEKINKILIGLALIAIPYLGYGQIQKCKYARNEIDSFSEQHIIVTKWYAIGESAKRSSSALKAEITKKDTTYILRLWADGGSLGCVSTSSRAHFKSSDGMMLVLAHIGGVDCGKNVYVGGMSAHSNPQIVLPLSSNARAFLKKPVSMVRLEYAESYGDYNITLPLNFQQILLCVESADRPK